MNSLFGISSKRSVNLSFIVLTVFLFLLLRASATSQLFSIDERIAPAVVAGMIQRGDVNGNWSVAVGIPVEFQVNQFNFYSYHLFARMFHAAEPAQFIKNLRFVNLALQAATLALLLAYVARVGLAARHRIAMAALFVTAPAMVFDTHIARTESFLYFLFALLIWTTQLRDRPVLRHAAFGLLLGIGCASKITFILCGAILIPDLIRTLRVDARTVLARIGILTATGLLGFFASAPYVLVDFTAFLDGVNALFAQYGTSHPPHSFVDPSLGKSISRTLLFVLLTTGALVPLALLQITRRPVHAPGMALFGLVLIAYFATKPVFFERNIGIGLLAILVFVALNIRSSAENWLLVASCGLMLYWSVNIAYIFGHTNSHEKRFELATFGELVPRVWPIEGLDAHLATCEGLIAVNDYNDEFSRRMLAEAQAVPVAHFTSVFAALPTSTLHTYLESDLHYYRCGTQGTG